MRRPVLKRLAEGFDLRGCVTAHELGGGRQSVGWRKICRIGADTGLSFHPPPRSTQTEYYAIWLNGPSG